MTGRKRLRKQRHWYSLGRTTLSLMAVALAGLMIALAGGIWVLEAINTSAVLRRYGLPLILLTAGMFIFIVGIVVIAYRLFRIQAASGLGTNVKLKDVYRQYAVLGHGPKIVAIGGGTGLSTLLRGLKTITSRITAVVTVADDGGNSGQLREELGSLPPGDIRNCLSALSRVEPAMEQLLQHRFKEGALAGQCMGNLLLVAMDQLCGGFLQGVKQMSNVLAVVGRVLPVSLDNIHLCAELEDGTVLRGESTIGLCQKNGAARIRRVWLDPTDCRPVSEVLSAIREADIIVMGPGSLYTSLLPNLLVPGVADAIREAQGTRIVVGNVMTQPGETEGYTGRDHLQALYDHCGAGIVDVVLLNQNTVMPVDVRNRYREDRSVPVAYDADAIRSMGVRVVERDLLDISSGQVRHHPAAVAQAILDIYHGKS